MPLMHFNGRPTIGLLSNTIDGGYQQTLLSGFVNAAKIRGVNTVYFSGGVINAFDLPRNRIHEIISTNNLDGLVIVSSIVCGYLSQEETRAFFDKFDKFPCLSIGMQTANVPSIIIDNKTGMKSIVDHLIEDHGYKNFFFIGGPENNLEAARRFAAFKESLEEHDLRIDPEMISNGNFYPPKIAFDLTKELLNKKKCPDAIVSANDIMAIGAMNAIHESKMLIPDDIAVTGYDDLKNLRFLSVPLTTVRQPFADMTAKALNMILDMIDGKDVPQITSMNTEPVIRRSCGCLLPEINIALKKKFTYIPSGKDLDAGKICDEMIGDISQDYSFGNIKQKKFLMEAIISLFVKAAKGEIKKDKYALMLDRTFRQSGEYEEEPLWDVFFALLQKIILSYYRDSPEKITEIVDIIELSGIILNKISHQNELNIRTKIIDRSRTLQYFESRLLISFDINYLLETMYSELGSIGIRSCFLSLHAAKEKIFHEARMILAYDECQKISIDEGGLIFPADHLIPDGLINTDRRFDFIIESLLYEEEQLGFIVLEMDFFEGMLLTPIINHIASSIKASMLMNEAVQKGKDLEKTLKELKENQKKLIISEKMASIGRFSAGIAHEMNTTLAAIRTNHFELLKLVDEYKKSRNEPDVTEEDFNGIIDDIVTSVNLANKSADKALSFIRGIKKQTVEIDKRGEMNFIIADVIRTSILMTNHILLKYGINVDFSEFDDRITLFGVPERLQQVMINLISNAVEAMSGMAGGVIKIGLFENEKYAILYVSDRGCGIPDSILTKIFDPMFSTKPFGEATGLGLTIAHDIIYAEFNGYIEVESAVNSGTTFRLFLSKS